MKCVRYTRASFYTGASIPVSEQIAEIEAYARTRGWKVSRSFSDRKNVPDADKALVKMKDFGIMKAFDVVIFYSTRAFGCHPGAVWDVLYKLFYPVNVHFAVVEDDFFSGEHSETEIIQYIRDRQDQMYRMRANNLLREKVCKGILSPSDEKYGYFFNPEKKTLEIDENTAQVVRRIFAYAAEGLPYQRICDLLNAEHIPSPAACREKSGIKRFHSVNDLWTACSVSRISKNMAYGGKLRKKIGTEYMEVTIPAIVPQELFQRAQRKNAARQRRRNEGKKKDNPFSGLVLDGLTGEKVYCVQQNGEFCFRTGKNREKKACGGTISYDAVQELVLCEIRKEHQAAMDARRMVVSGEFASEKAHHKDRINTHIQSLFRNEDGVIQKKNLVYRRFANNEIKESEYLAFKKNADEEFRLLEADVKRRLLELSEIDKIYSVDNPWIKAFSDDPWAEKPSRTQVKRLVKQISIMPNGEIHVELHFQHWKQLVLGKEIHHEP